jgi:general secretion pathway protein I
VKRGFTLLEVMIAIAILGIGLTVILTSQTGLFSSSQRAANVSVAIGLARCKMNEVEADLLRDGFPIIDESKDGVCCEDDESQFQCTWQINTVTMPELGAMGGGADAGAGGESDPLGALMGAKDSLAGGDTTGAIKGLESMIPGGSSAGPSLGAGALAPMAMGIIYPQLKAMLEASIRKVIVTVKWREGSSERDLSVTQYLTNPTQGGFIADDGTVPGDEGAGGTSGTSTQQGTGATTSRSPANARQTK